jgi:N-methylhydantoinase B
VLVICYPGGGGYGDPRSREPVRVHEDVRNGYVSADAAKRLYGVDA